MASRLQTLSWFLRRPSLYLELLRAASAKFRGSSKQNESSAEATAWCAARAVTSDAALQRITGTRREPLASAFAEVLTRAQQVAAECPVRMGGPGGLDLMYGLAEHVQAKQVVETGVAYGWSSLALLLSLQKRPGSRLISVDMPYPNLDNDTYVGCVVPAELRSHWRLIRSPDREGLPKALRELGTLDLCHYDSDKSYDGRMWAHPLLWKALRRGGYLVSDDINDNVGFRDFALQVGVEPIIVEYEGKYIGILER